MNAAFPTTTTAMPFIDAGTLLPALLDDSRSVLGAALVSFELLAEGQGSEVFWGALYPLRQGGGAADRCPDRHTVLRAAVGALTSLPYRSWLRGDRIGFSSAPASAARKPDLTPRPPTWPLGAPLVRVQRGLQWIGVLFRNGACLQSLGWPK